MPESAHVTTSSYREGIIRLATEYIRIAKVDIHTEARRVYIPVEGWWKEFNPFESPTDAYELESAIPEAKRWDYIMELRGLIDPSDPVTTNTLWLIAHATPRQRSQAALAVLDTEER